MRLLHRPEDSLPDLSPGGRPPVRSLRKRVRTAVNRVRLFRSAGDARELDQSWTGCSQMTPAVKQSTVAFASRLQLFSDRSRDMMRVEVFAITVSICIPEGLCLLKSLP